MAVTSIRRSMRRIAVRRFAGTGVLAHHLERPIRVAHVTDQHVGRATPHRVQLAAVAHVNRMRPDLVALTGDYVGHSLKHLDELEEILSRFKAPMIGVLGNHDHWTGADEVRRSLRRVGVEVLGNENTVLTVNGQRLQVVGVDDAATGHADALRAVRGLGRDVPSIGLSHIAEEADTLWNHGVSLVLSGHTHSGQFSVGGIHRLTIGGQTDTRYVHGLYGCRRGERADGAVYVSAGIGAAVVGLRIGERARREVASFELGLPPDALQDEEHHTEQPPVPERRVDIARNEWQRLRRQFRQSWVGAGTD